MQPVGDELTRLKAENKTLRLENKRLKELVVLDPLTEIYNRRGLEQRLAPLLDEVRYQTKQPQYLRRHAPQSFALVIIDIDYFKRVNDQYGHESGDEVLKQFGRRIQQSLRATDVFGRWGGEEFMLGLADVDAASAQIVVAKLHEAIRSQPFRLSSEHGAETAPITASFGVAFAHPKETIDRLKQRADRALFQSKQAGRDTITIHTYTENLE